MVSRLGAGGRTPALSFATEGEVSFKLRFSFCLTERIFFVYYFVNYG
jgi:hypothetical protein